MQFIDELEQLLQVSFYTAPSTHDPQPYVIPENRQIVELLTAGVVYFQENGTWQTYRRGTIFWHIPGDSTIFHTSRQEPYQCMVFHFQSSSAQRIAPRVSCWRGNDEALTDFLRESHSTFFTTRNDPESAAILDCYCASLLLLHARGNKVSAHTSSLLNSPGNDENILRNLLLYIEKHLSEPLTASVLTDAFQLPRNKLFRLFREQLQTTPHNYLQTQRLELARRLLESTQQPIKSIAGSCGFEHVEVFHRFFCRQFKQTPAQYRRNNSPYHA